MQDREDWQLRITKRPRIWSVEHKEFITGVLSDWASSMLFHELLAHPECSHPSPPNPQHLKAKNEQQTLLSSKAWMFTGNVAKTYLESMYYVSCRISTLVEFCGEGWSFLVHSCLSPDGPVSTWLLRTSVWKKRFSLPLVLRKWLILSIQMNLCDVKKMRVLVLKFCSYTSLSL